MKTEKNNEQQSKAVCLEEKQIFSFKKPEKIFVTSGKVWITIDGDAEDYIYGEGDTFKVPNGRHAVLQSIGKSSFWF